MYCDVTEGPHRRTVSASTYSTRRVPDTVGSASSAMLTDMRFTGEVVGRASYPIIRCDQVRLFNRDWSCLKLAGKLNGFLLKA